MQRLQRLRHEKIRAYENNWALGWKTKGFQIKCQLGENEPQLKESVMGDAYPGVWDESRVEVIERLEILLTRLLSQPLIEDLNYVYNET